jgi:NhaP-type Na+/H+ and K+/H+ antiporter
MPAVKKILGMMLLVVGVSGAALAVTTVPEIDPGSGISPLALLSGAILVFRARKK